MSATLTYDAKSVLTGNQRFLFNHRSQIERAILKTAMRIAHDAIFEEPRPPIDWGVLRGSVFAYTRTLDHAIEGPGPVSKKRTPSDKPGEAFSSLNREGLGHFAGRVAFLTAYAARLHETPPALAANWPSKDIDPGVGPKWLESTHRNGAEYNALTAEFVREETGQ